MVECDLPREGVVCSCYEMVITKFLHSINSKFKENSSEQLASNFFFFNLRHFTTNEFNHIIKNRIKIPNSDTILIQVKIKINLQEPEEFHLESLYIWSIYIPQKHPLNKI